MLNRHVIFEYTDLSDSEFRAWIVIMALTGFMEAIPTREQMLKHVHYKTLDSLQRKFNTRSIDLQYVLNKVSIDAQGVAKRRESWKEKQREKRARMLNVSEDVSGDVSDKRRIREDKEKIKNNTPLTPQGGNAVPADFNSFWTAYPRKIGKAAALKAWRKVKPPLAQALKAISTQKQSDQWRKDGGQYIPNPATWINQGRWEDEPMAKPREQSSVPAERKLPTCTRCEREAEVVEFRGQMLCAPCLRIVDPEIDERLKGLVEKIGVRA